MVHRMHFNQYWYHQLYSRQGSQVAELIHIVACLCDFQYLTYILVFQTTKLALLVNHLVMAGDQTTCGSAIYLPPQTELQLLAHEVDIADTPPASCNTGPVTHTVVPHVKQKLI